MRVNSENRPGLVDNRVPSASDWDGLARAHCSPSTFRDFLIHPSGLIEETGYWYSPGGGFSRREPAADRDYNLAHARWKRANQRLAECIPASVSYEAAEAAAAEERAAWKALLDVSPTHRAASRMTP